MSIIANISTRALKNNEELITGIETGVITTEKFLQDYVPTRTDLGQFFTPKEIVEKMLSFVEIKENSKVCEPSCGTGNILSMLPKDAIGIEWHKDTANLARKLTGRKVVNDNLFTVHKSYINNFDVILANPPFGDTPGRDLEEPLEVGKTRAEIMTIECIYHMLKDGGQAVLLLPTMISQGGRNYKKLYKFIEDHGSCLEMVHNCGIIDFKTTKVNVGIYEMWK